MGGIIVERQEINDFFYNIVAQFDIDGTLINAQSYGNGHINLTYLLEFIISNGDIKRYILQRINRTVFTKPEDVMENILSVTKYLRNKIIEKGGDPERETMNVIPTKEGKSYFVDEKGEYWRAYIFIEDALSLDRAEKPEYFYESAVAFGGFQYLLSDFPADTLCETIKGFHDTKKRFETFIEAVRLDVCNRAINVKKEIDFILNRKDVSEILGDALKLNAIPIRVTHNDTKLNNIMLDKKTGKGICVIDLDTVMPGLSVNDFGDSIRFGASTGSEDETNLDNIWCDLELFELYTKGFIKGCNGGLTKTELQLLPVGAKVMTFEVGTRFLTDYLQGDTYFRIHRKDHNLDRCRTQLKLVSDMETKWDEMNKIVERYF